MKKTFIVALTTIFVGMLYSQELQTITFDQSQVNNGIVTLSDNWMSTLDNNLITVFNGRINNESKDDVRNLNLTLYLLAEGYDLSSGQVQGYKESSISLKRIKKNSNLVGVSVKDKVSEVPPAGLYQPLLVLSDKSGKILTYQLVNNLVESKDGSFAYFIPTPVDVPVEPIKEPDLNPVVTMNIDENNSLSLVDDWQIEIDFKNFVISVVGGDIVNKTQTDFKSVILDVFLTNEQQSTIMSSFNGVLISSANIDEIKKNSIYNNTTVKTNLQRIPEKGTYYLLLTLSVPDEKGNQVVVTKRSFPNTITF